MLTPIEFGLPPKFREWRAGQLDAIDLILESKERFAALCAPTGFGKSLVYMAAAMMSGLRMVVCTSTKGLQDQLTTDFGTIKNSVDLRGQSNYPCKLAPQLLMPSYTTVEMGPCHSGVVCELKYSGGRDGCEYYTRYGVARNADIVTTNYALWMYDGLKSGQEDKREGNLQSKRPVDVLVLDEAHDAVEALAGFVGEEIGYGECRRAGVEWMQWKDGGEGDRDKWKEWAQRQAVQVRRKLERAEQLAKMGQMDKKLIREVMEWKRIGRKLGKVEAMQGEWCVEEVKENPYDRTGKGPSVRFDPLWPAHYAESALFRNVRKVILVSATVRPKTLDLLGVSTTQANFQEFPSTFPLERRPVIHVPTVQMNYHTEQDDGKVMIWLNRMDNLIDQRLDRKGIIHSVSYKRSELISNNSRHNSRMLLHGSKNRQEVVMEYKSSAEPKVLVSPSVDTGYDFPYQECEYQIIAKLPFQNNQAKVVKERMKKDKEYSNYTTAQTLVQMTGRGMRAPDDRCETLIVDDSVKWFIGQARAHLPKWWLESVQWEVNAPQPLPKLK